MNDIIEILALLVIFLISLSLVYIIIRYSKKIFFHHKMIKENMNLFKKNNSLRTNKKNHNIVHVKNASYDLYCETIKNHLYIKLIKNIDNDALYINNKYEWLLKGKNTIKTIDIRPFLEEKFNHDDNKEIVKLVVLYPNCSAVLKYINECEIDIIYPTNKVYDTYIISYENLIKDEILKKK